MSRTGFSRAALPQVFTLADLKQRLDGDEQAAMTAASRWLKSGQVHQVAPPRPVFIRRRRGEALDEEVVCLALRRAFPSLVIIGGSALWRQGMSHDRDIRLDCAIPEAVGECALPRVRLHLRPAAWLDVVTRAGGLSGHCHGVPMLSAEMAVADAATFADVWIPDRNALHWERLSASRIAVARQAMQPMRV